MAADRLVHIIDDDAAVRRALVRLLRSMGLTAMTYETAQAVLDDAATLSSGCILLDLQMPGMGGFEVVRNLTGSRLPVIVIVTVDEVEPPPVEGEVGVLLPPPPPQLHATNALDISSASAKPPFRIDCLHKGPGV